MQPFPFRLVPSLVFRVSLLLSLAALLFLLLRRFLLFLGRGFAFLADEGNPLADVNLAALFHVNFGERSILGRFPFHRRLVGFDFSNDVAGRDFIALLLFPRDERPFRHRVAQFGHLISGMANHWLNTDFSQCQRSIR